MTKSNQRVVATRLSLDELAKARDGLILKGINKRDLSTQSQILRLAIYFMILECPDPKSLPTQESINCIQQLWSQPLTNPQEESSK